MREGEWCKWIQYAWSTGALAKLWASKRLFVEVLVKGLWTQLEQKVLCSVHICKWCLIRSKQPPLAPVAVSICICYERCSLNADVSYQRKARDLENVCVWIKPVFGQTTILHVCAKWRLKRLLSLCGRRGIRHLAGLQRLLRNFCRSVNSFVLMVYYLLCFDIFSLSS